LPRPRRLLVFINPKSGHRKSVKIYRTKVRPLFKLAGIYTEIVETTRVGQPIDLLAKYDLSLIHGIVSIGGDGMFSECVNGLLRRLQADSKVDADDANADITPSNIPIGIIPTGSGNYLMNYIHGTKDVETATLKIILGDHHMSNVVSLHEGQRLTRYASLLVEFGLIGDMMHDCEKFRWMGPCRYSVIPMKSLAKRKVVDVKLEYLPEDAKAVSSPPRRRAYSRQKSLPASQIGDIPRSRLFSNPEGSVGKKINGWKQMEGSVYGVDSYVVTQREKQGALVPRFADDALTVWMTDKCGLSDHVEQLSRLQNAKSGFLNFDFVRKVRTTRYRVKLSSAAATLDSDGKRHLKKKFYINADGEAIKLDTPEFEVKLHHEAMPIYGKIDGLP
ncbi:CERK1-like protein, partial [Mya arenaria]